jgi:hypothetical protein
MGCIGTDSVSQNTAAWLMRSIACHRIILHHPFVERFPPIDCTDTHLTVVGAQMLKGCRLESLESDTTNLSCI